MKQPKVFAPEPPASIPPVVKGPRYRYFSTPPKTVTIQLADLASQIPAEVRTAQFSEFRSVELPCADILQGPVPKIRLSRLAEVLPEAVKQGSTDPFLRLPVARLAANYRFVNTEELIEDKPLPPLEPMPNFSSSTDLADELDLPPDELSPADLTFAPKDFTAPAPLAPPPAPIQTSAPVPPAAPAPEVPVAPQYTPPTEAAAAAPSEEPPKPAKKPFSLLPMFRRKEAPVAPTTPPPPLAPVEPRPRVEIPKQRTVLPPITARVAEAAAAAPAPQPVPETQGVTPSEESPILEPIAESLPEPEFIPDTPPDVTPTFVAEEKPPATSVAPQPAPSEEPAAVWVETEHLPKSPVGRSVEIPDQDGLQSVFMTEEILSVERVLELSGGLPGIKSCILSQGSTVLASHNVPDTIDLVSLSANAVEMLKAMRQSVAKMGVGAIPAVTIHSEKGPITFFHQEDLCLLVLHKDRGFVPGVREKLQMVVTELAQTNLALPVSPVKPSLGE